MTKRFHFKEFLKKVVIPIKTLFVLLYDKRKIVEKVLYIAAAILTIYMYIHFKSDSFPRFNIEIETIPDTSLLRFKPSGPIFNLYKYGFSDILRYADFNFYYFNMDSSKIIVDSQQAISIILNSTSEIHIVLDRIMMEVHVDGRIVKYNYPGYDLRYSTSHASGGKIKFAVTLNGRDTLITLYDKNSSNRSFYYCKYNIPDNFVVICFSPAGFQYNASLVFEGHVLGEMYKIVRKVLKNINFKFPIYKHWTTLFSEYKNVDTMYIYDTNIDRIFELLAYGYMEYGDNCVFKVIYNPISQDEPIKIDANIYWNVLSIPDTNLCVFIIGKNINDNEEIYSIQDMGFFIFDDESILLKLNQIDDELSADLVKYWKKNNFSIMPPIPKIIHSSNPKTIRKYKKLFKKIFCGNKQNILNLTQFTNYLIDEHIIKVNLLELFR